MLCARTYAQSASFVVKATLRDGHWVVTHAQIAGPSRRGSVQGEDKQQCPFPNQQLVPKVLSSIREKPALEADLMRIDSGLCRLGWARSQADQNVDA